jgi:hypothetical protein
MVKIIRSIAIFLLTINPTFIPHRFGNLDLRYSVNLIKRDRAQRDNKSLRGVGPCGPYGPEAAIQNPQSKIALKSWFNGIKTG